MPQRMTRTQLSGKCLAKVNTLFNAPPLKSPQAFPVNHTLKHFADPFAGSGGFQLGASPFMVARVAASREDPCADPEPSEMTIVDGA